LPLEAARADQTDPASAGCKPSATASAIWASYSSRISPLNESLRKAFLIRAQRARRRGASEGRNTLALSAERLAPRPFCASCLKNQSDIATPSLRRG
jgi:hypothetical protein